MPLEIERKFLVQTPPVFPDGLKVETRIIEQHYLTPASEYTSERVRKANLVHTHTGKKYVTLGVNEEVEHIITPAEHQVYVDRSSPAHHVLHKHRHCFEAYLGTSLKVRVLELDVYVSPHKGLGLLEIEVGLDSELTSPVTFPSWLQVVREVTGDIHFSNEYLARISHNSAPIHILP